MAEAIHLDDPANMPKVPVAIGGQTRRGGWLASPFRESSARTDLKWVFGLPFTFLLALFLAALSLFLVTGREGATGTIAAMQEQILAEPQLTGDLPVKAPGFYAFLASTDFADAVYENPGLMQEKIDAIPDQLPGVESSPENLDENASGPGSPGAGLRQMLGFYSSPVRLLGSDVHTTAGAVMTVLLVLMVITGVPYLLFSRRLGRLVSLGLSTAIASLPGLGLLSLIDARMAVWMTESRQATGEEEGQRIVAAVTEPFAGSVLGGAISAYRLFAIVALLSLATAAIGCTLRHIRGRAGAQA